MLKNKVTTLVATAALGLSVGLVGCAGADGGTATTTDTDSTVTTVDDTDVEDVEDVDADDKASKDDKDSTSNNKKGLFDGILNASGYQGTLEDGKSILYIKLAGDTTIISLTDDTHQGDDAETYSGKATKDASGKITVTDEESGKSISLTVTENGDGTADVDVEGHGKGNLKAYEGNILSVISELIGDDTELSDDDEEDTTDDKVVDDKTIDDKDSAAEDK